MGILNVTPDSFSDGGLWSTRDRALEHALALCQQGADILDVGGESTRPGAQPVSESDEMERVLPIVQELVQRVTIPISVDTTKSEVARRALDAGASIVNDVSGLLDDPRMADLCARYGCGVIVMHRQGTPQTMQLDPRYDDVVQEVECWLADRIAALAAAGIPPERIVVDPGIGFGKTAAHNLALLRSVAELRARTGRPVLIGHSRKRFLGKLLGRPVEERTAGTIGVALAVAHLGADIVRVHDVGVVRDALRAWRAVAGPHPPGPPESPSEQPGPAAN